MYLSMYIRCWDTCLIIWLLFFVVFVWYYDSNIRITSIDIKFKYQCIGNHVIWSIEITTDTYSSNKSTDIIKKKDCLCFITWIDKFYTDFNRVTILSLFWISFMSVVGYRINSEALQLQVINHIVNRLYWISYNLFCNVHLYSVGNDTNLTDLYN